MSSAAGVPARGEIIQIELGQASRQDRQFFTQQSCRALRKPEPTPAILEGRRNRRGPTPTALLCYTHHFGIVAGS